MAFAETTYVVPAWSCTGVDSVWVCQPEAVSPANVVVASFVPLAVQTVPVWTPVSFGSFQNRIALSCIGWSTVILTPNS